MPVLLRRLERREHRRGAHIRVYMCYTEKASPNRHRPGIQVSLRVAPDSSTFMGLFCLLRGGVGLEYDLVLLGLHCFLRLAHALYCHSG